MTFGSLFQIIGAAGAVLFLLLHVPIAAAIFMALHFAGDVIEELFRLPSTSAIAKEAAKYVKLRPFLLFVGLAFMFGGLLFGGVHGWFKAAAYVGLFVALIGAFTYDLIYT